MKIPMLVTAYTLAHRFAGLTEVAGAIDNPQIMAMLKLDNKWPEGDETPWCSAFVNYICWLLRIPRSKSLRARSWLEFGESISLAEATVDWVVIILIRGPEPQPGPNVIDAPGHVGFYAGTDNGFVRLLGGNQANKVSINSYPTSRILGIRRL